MSKFKDISGQRYSRLIPFGHPIREGKVTYWTCKCDCGSEKKVRADGLRAGTTKSCGCLQKEKASSRNQLQDISGKRYGRLVVLGIASKEPKKTKWKCKCDCGNICVIFGESLRQSKTKSCGCLARELSAKRMYNPNLTEEDRDRRRIYKSEKYNKWRTAVFIRDKRKCQICKSTSGEDFVVHHKDGWSCNRERRFDISNGVCLCGVCHTKFHKMFGSRQNTEQEYKQFVEIMKNEPQKIQTVVRKKIDQNEMLGRTFGYLTVKERVENKGNHVAFKCHCQCGEESIVKGKSLRRGETKSCGCMTGQLISSAKRGLANEY
jgi:5-methylcytosine-specific restriction endonuclease McrA